MEVGGDLGADGQLVVAAHRPEQLQALDCEAAVVEARLLILRVGDTHVQVQLFQGPGVGLGHALACSRHKGFRVEQSSHPYCRALK